MLVAIYLSCEVLKGLTAHPDVLPNVTGLTCAALSHPEPDHFQTWHFLLREGRTLVRREYPRLSVEFGFADRRFIFT